jgi:hypothetical protein
MKLPTATLSFVEMRTELNQVVMQPTIRIEFPNGRSEFFGEDKWMQNGLDRLAELFGKVVEEEK